MLITATLRSTNKVVLLVMAGVVAGLMFAGGAAFASMTWTPPDDTITRITGTEWDGFTIEHYDGSVLYPPTNSESIAECGEYDTRIARVRCRVEVRTWYDALGDTRRALRYARTQ